VVEGLLGKRLHVDDLFGDQDLPGDRILALAHTVVKGKVKAAPDPERAGSLHLGCGLLELRYIRINGMQI
jgi:hypothetical protein